MKILSDKLELVEIDDDYKAPSKSDTFVITRFNLRLWAKDKHNHTTQSEEWLKQRFELFEKFCFPSLEKQTNKDFIWFCLFDAGTPKEYLKKIQNYENELTVFVPVFFDEKDSANVSGCTSELITKHKNDSQRLITIRLDNDDALNVKFVDKVNEYALAAKGTTILSFKYGIQYFTTQNLAVHIPFYNNHFLVMVNNEYEIADWKERKVQHVLQFNHFDTENYPCLFVCDTKEKDMWAEVIHATNVSNDCKMTLNQSPVQEPSFLTINYNWGGQMVALQHVSKSKFWRFMAVRFVKHIVMKISSKF